MTASAGGVGDGGDRLRQVAGSVTRAASGLAARAAGLLQLAVWPLDPW